MSDLDWSLAKCDEAHMTVLADIFASENISALDVP